MWFAQSAPAGLQAPALAGKFAVLAPAHVPQPYFAKGSYFSLQWSWPALPNGALLPGYAGIRPKISGPLEVAADFWIEGPRQHGVSGLVNLFGIESPGLTSCLVIGDYVANLLST